MKEVILKLLDNIFSEGFAVFLIIMSVLATFAYVFISGMPR